MATPYTHRKLTDVQDSGAKFGLDAIQEARFANNDLDAADTGVSHQRLKPGKRQRFGHKHDQSDARSRPACGVPSLSRRQPGPPWARRTMSYSIDGEHHERRVVHQWLAPAACDFLLDGHGGRGRSGSGCLREGTLDAFDPKGSAG